MRGRGSCASFAGQADAGSCCGWEKEMGECDEQRCATVMRCRPNRCRCMEAAQVGGKEERE